MSIINKVKKAFYKVNKNNEALIQLRIENLRRQGMTIGENCRMIDDIKVYEPYLVKIGSNVTLSNDIWFITHDSSISKFLKDFTDCFGEISVGNNCFIGNSTILLPGVALGNNVVVAAGSVVTKSFGDDVVIGGNPARIIRPINDEYKEKISSFGFNMNHKNRRQEILSHRDKLIKR